MKTFKQLREKNSVNESKLIAEEVNERAYSEKDKLIQQAVGIAMNMGGNMTGAYKKIQALGKKGGMKKLEDHPIITQALRLANESVNEGTMAIGIKDRDPKERAKAKQQLVKMLKKDGNKKVGSKEGRKFDEVLDTYILSDDELADEFANPKNKNMKIIDLLKKHSKRLNVNFSESIDEKSKGKPLSPLQKKTVMKLYKDVSKGGPNAQKALAKLRVVLDVPVNESLEENVKAVMKKHKKHIDKWKRSNKPMPIQVEDELMQAAMKAGEIKTDDPEEFDSWLDRSL